MLLLSNSPLKCETKPLPLACPSSACGVVVVVVVVEIATHNPMDTMTIRPGVIGGGAEENQKEIRGEQGYLLE